VICTHNRAAYLADAIRSVQAQDYPAEAYEIIVVDNASTDDTRTVVEGLNQTGLHPVKYIYEPQPGLSRARNTGALASVNEIVAYIDDDAIADQKWLAGLANAYQEGIDQIVCVGGAAQLRWEGERPDWFPSKLEGYLSGTGHLGDRERALSQDEFPVGANFSIRRAVLLKMGGFNISLGRLGTTLLSGEESEMCQRVWADGGVILYAPGALVYHRVPADRVTLRYLLRRAYWQGISDVIMEQRYAPRCRMAVLRSSVALLFQSLRNGANALWALIRGRRNRAVLLLFDLVGRWGRVRAQIELIWS
jgi:glycosyltransferase involved in cell wall biosynthesis